MKCLRERGQREDDEAQRDGADAGARAQGRAIDEAVRVLVSVVMVSLTVLGFSEPKRWRLELMWFAVRAEDGAVGCAKMAHAAKLANSARLLGAQVSGASVYRRFSSTRLSQFK